MTCVCHQKLRISLLTENDRVAEVRNVYARTNARCELANERFFLFSFSFFLKNSLSRADVSRRI